MCKNLEKERTKVNNKRKKGISLIALVITIIVIIILATIAFFASTGTVENANYAKFTTNISEVESEIREKALSLKGDEALRGKQLTDGQIYNYVAKGGKTDSDYLNESSTPKYTIIDEASNINLPEMKVNTPTETNVKITYAVTDEGEVFVWPPYGYDNEYYVTGSEKVDKDQAEKPGAGDIDIKIDNNVITIKKDDDGKIKNEDGTSTDEPDVPIKIKLTKPNITGSYVYNGNTQTVTLSVFDSNTMAVSGNTRKDAGNQAVTVSLKDTSKYEWSDGTTSAVVLNWTVAKKSISVSWSNLNFECDGANHVPIATLNGVVAGDTVSVNVSGTASTEGEHTATATLTGSSAENYELTNTTTKFTIVKTTVNVNTLTITLSGTSFTYTEAEIKPTVTIKNGATTLSAGTDYTLSYGNNKNAGTATITIKGNGKYVGTITKNFTIERAKTAMATASNKSYTGSAQIGVTGTNVDLSGTTSATNVGTYTATATPKANYAWSDGTTTAKTLTWKITEKASSSLTVTLATTTYTYDGTAKEPAVTVKDGSTTLTLNTYYTVSYSNNVNAGTATITITMKGNYSGTITKNFTIERAKTAVATASNKSYTGSAQIGVTGTNVDLSGTTSATNIGTYTATATPKANYAWSDGTTTSKTLTWKITEKASASLTVTLATTTYTYDGTAREPVITVKDSSTTLTLNTHYTVAYSNNTNAGTATVTITMKGNYSGTITKNFTIERAKTASATASDKTYNSSVQMGVTGTNVDLSGTTSATNVGIYTATATPKANYAWSDGTTTSKTLNWKITEKASSSLTVTLATTTYTYDGTAKEPTVAVKDGTKTLTAGTDYTVSYSNNINAGTATVTITLKGNYNGTITKTFTIERAKTATATASDKVYTGANQVGVIGTNVDLVGTTSATNVGTYTATATPKTNYAWADGSTTSKALTWKITAKTGNDITAELETTVYTYDGTAKEPTVTVKDGTKVLVVGTDYGVKYIDNVNAGTATVRITLKGNYSGTITKTFTIERAKTATATASDKVYTGANQVGVVGTNVDLTGTITATEVGTYIATATPKSNYAWADGTITSKTLTWKISAKSGNDITAELGTTVYTYDGAAKEPTVTVKDGTKTLTAGTDYTVSYSNNINAGTATVTITLKGNYEGTIEKTFTIERAKTATAIASNKTYTGAAQIGVTGVNVDLKGTVSATAVGTYTATATPKANYAWADGSTDAKTLTWKITEKASSDIVATLSETVYTYDGTAKEPEVTVKDETKVLVVGTDYTVSYSNNINAGTATVTITLKGNYSGTITKTFTIERSKTATATASDKVYTGANQVGVIGTNVDLVGTTSATNVGTYTATATPKTNYAWADGSITSKTLTWKITAKSGTDITAELSSTTYVYDGTAKEPTVIVKDGTKVLVAGTDYDVEYIDNVNAGTATVTITLKGNYSGTITKTFTIERTKTATAAASDKIYTGELQTGVTGVNVNLVGVLSATNVGTYTATATPKTNYAWADGSTTSKTLTWKITAKSGTDITASLSSTTYVYDGTAKEPTVTVKDGTKTLVVGTDYDVEYRDNVNAGTATVTITMKGNYSGTITKNFTIERAKTAVATASNKSYTGTAQIGVTGTNVDLSGTTSATNVGTYTATATPKANYAWSDGTTTAKTLNWKITEKASSSLTVTLATTTYTYDGTAKEPTVAVKDGTNTLAAGTDYTVSYSNNINAGVATVTITMKGNYSGTITKNFTIERAKTASATASDKTYNGSAQMGVTGTNVDLSGTTSATNVGTYTATATPKANYAWSDGTTTAKTLTWKITEKASSSLTVTLVTTTYTYDGTAKEPAVTVKDGSTTLTLNTHYTVAYSSNTNAGTATVTITMKGNYSGTITKNFTIERAKTASATASDKTYNGSAQMGVTGTNVDLSGTTSATNVGTYTATATPKANYAWSDGTTTAKTLTWKITEKASSSLTVTLVTTTYTYDGTAKEPAVTVKDGSTTLTSGTHYTVSYSNNTNAGTATVTITMKGNYSGTITKNFTIERAKTASATASDKTYNGSAQMGVTGTNVDLSGTTSATNVGTYTATATPKANYAWSDGTTTAKTLTWKTIAKTLTVTPTSGQGKSYGTSDNVLTYTYEGQVSGQTPAFEGALARQTGEYPGDYIINKGTLALKDNGTFLAKNYTLVLSSTTVYFTIFPDDNYL